MKKSNEAKLVITALSASIAAFSIGTAQAANPFAATDLGQGYMVAAAHAKEKDGKCGEGKCGEKKGAKDGKAKDGKCGEGKCGEGKCGAKNDTKAKDGKCGEGKCGKK